MAKLSKLEQAAVDMLPEIVAATQSGGYIYLSAFDVAYLIENELVEQNEEIEDANGWFATRATSAGIEYVMTEVTKQPDTIHQIATEVLYEQPAQAVIKVAELKPERKLKMSFVIENIPVVAGKRGGGTRAAKYPFDALEIGQSFFVATDKSIASALTNAMKKFDVADLDEAGNQKTKTITVPKTGEKRNIPATKHVRVFKAVAESQGDVAGFRVGRTA